MGDFWKLGGAWPPCPLNPPMVHYVDQTIGQFLETINGQPHGKPKQSDCSIYVAHYMLHFFCVTVYFHDASARSPVVEAT